MKRLLAMVWALARPAPTIALPKPTVERIATKVYQTAHEGIAFASHVCCFMRIDGENASTVDTTHQVAADAHVQMIEDRAAWTYHGELPDGVRRIGEPRKARPTAILAFPGVVSRVDVPGGGDAA